MLNGANLRSIYSKIQTHLLYMIPEKWERIYLYAALVEDKKGKEKGEMFFYYYPTGILKKNPINVYEVPARFNLEESSYMKLVDELYDTIKLLKQEFKRAKEKPWTNLTISIEDLKFKIEYNYDDLSAISDDERHLIWQYKYLDLTVERLPKKQRKIIEQYLQNESVCKPKTKRHTENMYNKKLHNIIEYDRPEIIEEDSQENKTEKKKDKYELYKEEQAKKQKEIEKEEQKEEKKNQILNF